MADDEVLYKCKECKNHFAPNEMVIVEFRLKRLRLCLLCFAKLFDNDLATELLQGK